MSWSAHAFATAECGVVLPDAVAHPPFSTNSVCLHEAVCWNSVSFTMASGCFIKLSTQIGVKRATTAAFARSVAICSAVLLRVQPHQAKPIIIIATAPMTAPHTPGFIHCGTCISYSFLVREKGGSLSGIQPRMRLPSMLGVRVGDV